jgi:multidrug resistance efflux pump
MELDVKTRNTTESLKCILTDDEIRRYGIAQARANAEIATAEEELQSVKSQYKSRVDAATANRNDMAKRINNGYEFRQVECIEKWDYNSNVISVFRTDNYETVSRRTMTRDEMQRKLF